MKKQSIFRRIGAIMLCAALLGGCVGKPGSQNTIGQNPPYTKESGESEKNIQGSLCVYLEATYANPLPNYPIYQAIQSFAQKHPELEIQFVSPGGGVSDYDAREAEITRLNAEIMAGGGPDLFLMGTRFTDSNLFPDLQKAMRNGAFLECGNLLQADGIDLDGNDFWPNLMQTGKVGAQQYIVPLSFDLLLGAADETTLQKSEFPSEVGNTEDFIAQCIKAYAKQGATTNLEEDLSVYMAKPLLDYNENRVQLQDTQVQKILELNKQVQNNKEWMQGIQDFLQESKNNGLASYEWREAKRLASGERLMQISDFSMILPSIRALQKVGNEPVLRMVPNEEGGATAMVRSYGMINANTKNPRAAAALLAYLLSDSAQGSNSWPNTVPELPVRRQSMAQALKSDYERRKNIWWLAPTEEQKKEFCRQTGEAFEEVSEQEKQDYLDSLGGELNDSCISALEQICDKINAAHLQSLWYDSVSTGTSLPANKNVVQIYQSYLNDEIGLDRLVQQLEPYLQLYLYE